VNARIRIALGLAVVLGGVLLALLAWDQMPNQSRAEHRTEQGAGMQMEPERLANWPTAQSAPTLSGVRFRFEDARGAVVHPDAHLINQQGSETSLRVEGDEQKPMRPIVAGAYTLGATSPHSGWAQTSKLHIEEDGLQLIRFEPPRRPIRIRVVDEEGTPWRGELQYRVTPRPRFTPYSLRHNLLILDISMGDDVLAPLPATRPWRSASGPEFMIDCERPATLRLEVQSTEGLTAHAWIDSSLLKNDDVVDVVLANEVPARIEVLSGGKHVGEGFVVQSFAAGAMTHEQWRVRTDAGGMARIPSFDGSLVPSYLLFAPGDGSDMPNSLLRIDDDMKAYLSASLMRSPLGSELDFPIYESVRWELELPSILREFEPRLELWLCSVRTGETLELFPFASATLRARESAVVLPSYIAEPHVVVRLAAPGNDLVATIDRDARTIRFAEPAELTGAIVDRAGAPVPGVELSWSGAREGAFLRGFRPLQFRRARATTDAAGRFRVLVSPPQGGVLRTSGGVFRPGEWLFTAIPNHAVQLRLEDLSTARIDWKGARPRGDWTITVSLARLGGFRMTAAPDAAAEVPLYEGGGLRQLTVTLAEEMLTLSTTRDLAPGSTVLLELPTRTSTRQIELRGANRGTAPLLQIGWSDGLTHVVLGKRVRDGTVPLRLPADDRQATVRVYTAPSFTAAGGARGQPAFEWRGPISKVPATIDLGAEREWTCSIVGADKPVLGQLVDANGRVQQFAVPPGPGTHTIKLRAATPPLTLGSVGGMCARLAARPAALDARAFAVGRPVRFSGSLKGRMQNTKWRLLLQVGEHLATVVLRSEEEPQLPAADGSTAWGMLHIAGEEGLPVRAHANHGKIFVEPAGRRDK